MKTRSRAGFTLIEIIAVLVVLGILAAIAVPRYVDLQSDAKDKAMQAGIAELNAREALTWASEMLKTSGSAEDSVIKGRLNTDLGLDYTLSGWPDTPPFSLTFRGKTLNVGRTISTLLTSGRWDFI